MKTHLVCTCCKKIKKEEKMKYVYYGMFQKYFWHCIECLSSAKDINYSELIRDNVHNSSTLKLTTQQVRNRICNNIRRIVKERNTTLTEIARIINIRRSTLSHQVSPKNNPSISSIIRIGNALQTDFRRFFYDYKVTTGIKVIYKITSSDKVINEMSNNIHKIMKNEKKSILEIAKQLKINRNSFVYKISPKNNPRINSLIKIAEVLDVDLYTFFSKE